MWMRELCEVLDYLHTRKPRILHSDIKPANIMVTPEGDICLIDFNISLDGSVTQEVQGLSRRYASPEQFRCAMDKMYGRKSSETLDERMDIYSLGAVFYRMMSGYLPDAQNGVPYALSQIDIPYADGLKRIVDKSDGSGRFKKISDGKTDGRSSFAYGKIRSEVPPSDELADIDRDCVGDFVFWQESFLLRQVCVSGGKSCGKEEYQEFLRRCGIRGFRKYNKRRNRTSEQFFFARLYERNKEQKAEVLHAVGDGYFYSEQYDTAGKYYEEALSCDSRNSLYVRDYMTAMARNGSPVDVWTIQSEYPEAAIDEAATVFVQAQSMYAKGDQKSAVSLCEEALGKSMDAELNAQIYLLEAELYLEQGDINSAADAAAQAVKLDESKAMFLEKRQ